MPNVRCGAGELVVCPALARELLPIERATVADGIEGQRRHTVYLPICVGSVRSAFYATNVHAVDAPVTLDILTECAELSLRRDLTVRHGDGHVDVVGEDRAPTAGRSYWGASHQLLIEDFYVSLGSEERFWIGAEEATASLRLIKDVYARS